MKGSVRLIAGFALLILLLPGASSAYDVLQPQEIVEAKCDNTNNTTVNAPSEVYLDGEQVELVNCSSIEEYEFGQVSEDPWSNYLSLQEFLVQGIIPSLAILLVSLETLRTKGLEDRRLDLSLKAFTVTSILALTYLVLDLTMWRFMTNPSLISQVVATVILISPFAVGLVSPIWILYREDERLPGLKKASIPVLMTLSLMWLLMMASQLSPKIFGATV